jgi:hypothetical protein
LTAEFGSSLRMDEDFDAQAAAALYFLTLERGSCSMDFQTDTPGDSPNATISCRFDFEIRMLYGPTSNRRRNLKRRCPNPSWPIFVKWPPAQSSHVGSNAELLILVHTGATPNWGLNSRPK